MKLKDGFLRDLPWIVKKFDYLARMDGQPVYRGYAPLGSADTFPKWVVFYSVYDVNNWLIAEYSREGAWVDRTTIF